MSRPRIVYVVLPCSALVLICACVWWCFVCGLEGPPTPSSRSQEDEQEPARPPSPPGKAFSRHHGTHASSSGFLALSSVTSTANLPAFLAHVEHENDQSDALWNDVLALIRDESLSVQKRRALVFLAGRLWNARLADLAERNHIPEDLTDAALFALLLLPKTEPSSSLDSAYQYWRTVYRQDTVPSCWSEFRTDIASDQRSSSRIDELETLPFSASLSDAARSAVTRLLTRRPSSEMTKLLSILFPRHTDFPLGVNQARMLYYAPRSSLDLRQWAIEHVDGSGSANGIGFLAFIATSDPDSSCRVAALSRMGRVAEHDPGAAAEVLRVSRTITPSHENLPMIVDALVRSRNWSEVENLAHRQQECQSWKLAVATALASYRPRTPEQAVDWIGLVCRLGRDSCIRPTCLSAAVGFLTDLEYRFPSLPDEERSLWDFALNRLITDLPSNEYDAQYRDVVQRARTLLDR